MHEDIQNNKLQLLGKLAASLSHEIRNPLSALKLSLEYLKQNNNSENDDSGESIATCLEATNRIEYLIQSILEFSKRPQDDSEAIDINDIIKKATLVSGGALKHKSVSLCMEIQKEVPKFLADKNKILQIVINVLTNAIEASNPGGSIVIRSYSKVIGDIETLLFCEIEDYGHGISAEDQEKIFSDFFTSKKAGTGLGLSVCRMIAEEYKAVLSFESEPGKGTIFRIQFPIVKKEG